MVIIVTIMVWFMDTDRYINDNIRLIDKANIISIVHDDKIVSYKFDQEIIDLVSYGGFIVELDNIFVQSFYPYSKKLKKMDIKIRYKKNESVLDTATVFKSNNDSEEYILYMNNVYWSTNSKITDLIALIE
ncbi:MAG: hypothetical protein U9N10_01250 [Bacillota bacterium]|nr:hypothetical protein [Bacillota bacterium]